MNERIKELVKQATTIEYGVDNGFARVTFDKEKFAELIIRECAEVANAHDCNHSGNDGAILNYFGVSV
jgi:hypothetical protein